MSIYYVYARLREDQTPYSIGKGKGDRAWAKDHNCSLPPRDRIVLLAEHLDEAAAYSLEAELIKYYGRKDLGTGILQNKTDGGRSPVLFGEQNGMTGRKHAAETLDLIRKSKQGKPRSNPDIQCSACNQTLKPQAYRSHCAQHHPDQDLLDRFLSYKCVYCDKKYAKPNTLRTHQRRAHPGCKFVKLVDYPAVADHTDVSA